MGADPGERGCGQAAAPSMLPSERRDPQSLQAAALMASGLVPPSFSFSPLGFHSFPSRPSVLDAESNAALKIRTPSILIAPFGDKVTGTALCHKTLRPTKKPGALSFLETRRQQQPWSPTSHQGPSGGCAESSGWGLGRADRRPAGLRPSAQPGPWTLQDERSSEARAPSPPLHPTPQLPAQQLGEAASDPRQGGACSHGPAAAQATREGQEVPLIGHLQILHEM